MPESDILTDAYAHELDAIDPLAHFRDRFYIQPGVAYLDGSLPIL